jgi:hypothetical protein
MPVLTVTEVRMLFYRLVDEVADSHEPVRLLEKGILSFWSSEDDWQASRSPSILCPSPE